LRRHSKQGAVAGRERGRLVEEEELGVEAAPDVALAALEVEHAADPAPRRPAPGVERARIGVEAAAAVAEQRAARRHGEERAEGVDAILQRHGSCP
jgi:hypothetical protein